MRGVDLGDTAVMRGAQHAAPLHRWWPGSL